MLEFTLTHPDAPRSLNAGGAGSRRHWGVAYREKKEWAEIFALLLEMQNVPRGMSHCHINAVIRWKEKRRRDSHNYIAPIIKPFADVLVAGAVTKPVGRIPGGWLPDDTDEYVTFGGVSFEYPSPWPHLDPRVKSELLVHLRATYPPEAQSEPQRDADAA